jgi:hypothetical protein
MNKRLLYFFVLSIFIASCSKENEVVAPKLTAYNASVVSYFKEIALGFEFGTANQITRRWEGKMKIFVGGKPTPELLTELNRIIVEINDLTTTKFLIESVSDTTQSNFYIFFGSGDSFARKFPAVSGYVATNVGLFSIFWDSSNELFKGYMYVDIFMANQTEQKHLLREEITQSLGLGKDSFLYPESIFQQSFSTKTTEYAKIDRDLIRLLYHPKMRIGLDRNEVDAALQSILLAEQ